MRVVFICYEHDVRLSVCNVRVLSSHDSAKIESGHISEDRPVSLLPAC